MACGVRDVDCSLGVVYIVDSGEVVVEYSRVVVAEVVGVGV